MTRTSTYRRILLRALAAVLGVLGAAAAAEVTARVFAAWTENARLDAWRKVGNAPDMAQRGASLGQVIRPSENPRRIYEFIPDIEVPYLGVDLRVNALGFRGPEVNQEKATRTIRVVGLGDSVMFGWRVPLADSFLSKLTKRLEREHPEREWEAINTAAPGYNTVMEVEALRDNVRALDPDLVLIDVVDNDFDLPNFIPHEPDYWSIETSFLAEYVVSAFRGWDTQAFRPLIAAPRSPDGRPAGHQHLSQVPERYRDMVGFDAFHRALRDLRELADEHGFEVAVSTVWRHDDAVLDVCKELDFAVVCGGDSLDRYMREHGIETPYGPPITLDDWDGHPSALAHGLVGESIAAQLEALGVITRLIR